MQARFNLWLEPSRNDKKAARSFMRPRGHRKIRIGPWWPRLPASPRVATRKDIGEHPETRSSSLPSGCRVLSIASPVNTHLPVQARERTALNRQNATSLLTIPIKGRALQGPSSSLTLSSQELWEVTLQQDSFASLTIPALCSARVISFKRRHQQGHHFLIQSPSQGRCK